VKDILLQKDFLKSKLFFGTRFEAMLFGDGKFLLE
jgi:hypothetical protein